EKNARKRYATALDLADDLRRYLAAEPVRARPVGGWERGWKWMKRRPLAASLAVVSGLLVVAMGAGGVGLVYSGQLQQQRDTAFSLKEQAESEREKARKAEAEADYQRDRAERLVYARQLQLALGEWEANNPKVAYDLLDGCQWKLRGWEHHYVYS